MGRRSTRLFFCVWPVLMLFVAMLGVILSVPVVKGGGTIYVRADGTIDPPTVLITAVNNTIYTLVDNINDQIAVERSNITIDGDGHTLQGSGSGNGFFLSGIKNVTIKNTNIKGFGYGVYLGGNSEKNTITKNNITDNDTGINFEYSCNDNTISENSITNDIVGVRLTDSSDNRLLTNNVTNNLYGVQVWYSSSNNIISNNNIAGIRLDSSFNNIVSRNNLTNNAGGIDSLHDSSSNTFLKNNFINNTYQVQVMPGYTNTWNGDYASGGNYWSDYTGVDNNSDGIGDTPYIIDDNNQDSYPLISWWSGEHELEVILKAPARLRHEDSTMLEATLSNYGLSNETNVSFFLIINNTIVNSTIISMLESGSSFTICYRWTPAIEGLFHVTTYVSSVLGETFFANNRVTTFVNTRTPVHNVNTGLYYFTIQEAIDASETLEGHTITVESGTYYEHIVVNKTNLALIGENASTTVIEGNSSDVVTVFAPSVGISNFTIRNGSNGIFIYASSYNTISGNIITNNTYYGLKIISSYNNILRNNRFSNCYSFYIESSSLADYNQDIDASNLVDGRPIYYWINRQNTEVPSDAGCVALVNCHNITVWGLELKKNGQGILLANTKNATITGNSITNNFIGIDLRYSSYSSLSGNYLTDNGEGINVFESSNNTISRNHITNNYNNGVLLMASSRDILSANNITDNQGVGIWLKSHADNNTISNNSIRNNARGCFLDEVSNNIVSNNDVTNNTGYGIWLGFSYSNTISENHITRNNEDGLRFVWHSSDNIVSGNNISNNSGAGVLLQDVASFNTITANNITENGVGISFIDYYGKSPSGNKIYHNSFVNNGRNGRALYPNPNIWDDGYPSGGNYWSDYIGADIKSGSKQDQPGRDGIGDTPCDVDRYPLMSPWPSGPGLHEIEVTLKVPTRLPPGDSTLLEATVINNGLTKEEKVALLMYINSKVVNSTTIALLEVGSSFAVNYLWTPTIEDAVNVTAFVVPVPAEILVENNHKTTFVKVSDNPPVQNTDTGLYYDTIQQAIDATDTLNGHTIKVDIGVYYEHVTITKSLTILGEDRTYTVIDGSKTGTFVVQITANNVVLSGFTIQNSDVAPNPAVTIYSSHNLISNNTIINNGWGIYAFSVSNNTIENNIITKNVYGINLEYSDASTVRNNAISDHQEAGIYLRESKDNTFTNNIIERNKDAVVLIGDYYYPRTRNNKFYHNNFIDNTSPGFAVNSDHNLWDNGYPSGGNYWSNYNGADVKSGPNQDQPGNDGIGDTAYTLSGSNQDRYPLVNSIGSPQPPIANFAYSPQQPVKGETVAFDASTSYDRDDSITSYKWDFGDGDVTAVTNPILTHIYAAEGTYIVNLTVTDNNGLSHSTTKSMTVTEDSAPPTTTHDYDSLWHTIDFTITLTATDDIGSVAETYYKINDGPTKTLSIDGQPLITTDAANNELEYWSVDKAGNEESHHILTGIKLDKATPAIKNPSRMPDGDLMPSQSVTVAVNVTDTISGIKKVTLSYTINDEVKWTDLPMNYNPSTDLYEATIPPQPAGTLVKYRITAYDNAQNQATNDNAGQYYVYTIVTEFPPTMIPPLLIALTMLVIIFSKRRIHRKPKT